jgi:hypothetical protein
MRLADINRTAQDRHPCAITRDGRGSGIQALKRHLPWTLRQRRFRCALREDLPVRVFRPVGGAVSVHPPPGTALFPTLVFTFISIFCSIFRTIPCPRDIGLIDLNSIETFYA